jgi:very-short-patch-repair endonuclease
LPFLQSHACNEPEFFIADFYCAEKKRVIEVDGRIHDFQVSYDRGRDDIMKELGLRVLRIQNDEPVDLEAVLVKIRSAAL